MPIEVDSLDSLSADSIQTREDFLIELINEAVPNLDLTKGGILEQLVAYPNALLDVMNQEELERIRQSMSLLLVAENPELADSDLLDSLLSNFLITRSPGSAAHGSITIVLSSLTSVVVPTTTSFTVNGRVFNPASNITAVTTQDLITNTNNVLIKSDGSGGYWFMVPVIESTVGGGGVLSGTAFNADPAPTDFVSAYAALDFSAGVSADSNTAAYSVLEEGISAKAMADRVSISGLIKSEFSGVVDLSTIGHGDSEMVRDAHNICGISAGGKADVYLRTSQNPSMRQIVIATQPMSAADYGAGANTAFIYLADFIIPPTVQPAMYRVEAMDYYPGAPTVGYDSSYILSWEEIGTRGIYVPTGEENMPAVFTEAEARYTKYQGNARLHLGDVLSQHDYTTIYRDRLIAALPFSIYTSEITTLGASTQLKTISDVDTLDYYLYGGRRFYTCNISYLPDIAEIQDFMNDYDHQAPTSADYLARAVIPCLVSISVDISYKRGLTPPARSLFQTAIASAINATPLGSTELPAATIMDAIEDVIDDDGYAGVPGMTAEILLPDGSTSTVTSSSALVIPNIAASPSVSNRTTAFMTYAKYIGINFREVD